MRVELLAPGRPSVGEKYVDMVRSLGYLLDQTLNITNLRAVGRHRDGLGARSFVGQGIESFASRVACGLLSGGDVDF
jgi:hypothetical protein